MYIYPCSPTLTTFSQISLKNTFGPKSKWCKTEIDYLATILKGYNILKMFFRNYGFW